MKPEIPDDLSDRFVPRRHGPHSAWVRRDFAPAFDGLGLLRTARHVPEEIIPEARPFRVEGGRGRPAVVPAPPVGEAVVRRYRRGGLPARLVRDLYLLGHRAFRELTVTQRLRWRGAPVPEPLAAVQSRKGPFYQAALVTVRVEGARPAVTRLRGRREGEAEDVRHVLRRMGRSTGRLHRHGGLHADLNAHNFLIPEDPGSPVVILDLDRARLLDDPPPARQARKNLDRLQRSLSKLKLETALRLWEAFEAGYREGREGEPPGGAVTG